MKKTQNRKPQREKSLSRAPSFKKRQPRHIWLNVFPHDRWLKVRQGETIWEALQHTDVELGGDCGGLGKCGKCKVKVLSAIAPPCNKEKELLDEEELKQGIRLACRTKVNHDLVISVGEPAAAAEYLQILTTSHILTTTHLPLLHFEPLVEKRLVTVPPDLQDEGLSDLDQVKMAMGPEYHDLKAPIHCLRTLPRMLKRTQFHGAAVLHDNCLMA